MISPASTALYSPPWSYCSLPRPLHLLQLLTGVTLPSPREGAEDTPPDVTTWPDARVEQLCPFPGAPLLGCRTPRSILPLQQTLKKSPSFCTHAQPHRGCRESTLLSLAPTPSTALPWSSPTYNPNLGSTAGRVSEPPGVGGSNEVL